HNLKVIGSNPIPATKFQALENVSFSRAFCWRLSATIGIVECARAAAVRCLHRDREIFRLHELGDAMPLPALASDAALLDAAERGGRIRHEAAIERDHA